MNLIIKALTIAAFSWHSTCGQDCNQNNNPAFGIDAKINGGIYTALILPNTLNHQSVILAKQEEYYIYGIATGYNDTFIPFILPKISIGPADISCISDTKTTVCMTVFKWRF